MGARVFFIKIFNRETVHRLENEFPESLSAYCRVIWLENLETNAEPYLVTMAGVINNLEDGIIMVNQGLTSKN